MAKNILVITGSPRVGGNSDRLAEAFARGAREAGHTVEVFAAGRAKIGPCRACDTCFSKGVPCSFEDDFDSKLAPLLEKADAYVLVSPLYWYDVSGQLKLAIDKFKAYSGRGTLVGKESALIMCGAVEDPALFDGAVQVYHRITRGSLKWVDRGVVLAPGCGEKGAVEKSPALQQAYDLGRAF